MDDRHWERLQAIFHEALKLAPAERQAYLQKECQGDHGLLGDVEAMLAEDALGQSLLDRGLPGVGEAVPEDPLAELPAGAFGPYRILRELGRGGMGVVYLAERADFGGLVAIKLLMEGVLSPSRRKRFAREQRTLAQVEHPQIAQIHDADTLANGTPWFAMEYVEGLRITDYCREHGCGIGERIRLFRAVSEAVRHAHSKAIIHCDLKPSNILVKAGGAVKLLDFGIARQLESDGEPEDLTRTGARPMTLAYAAPEQIRGDRLGTQTDVYALGVVLYELLAGRLPFDLQPEPDGGGADRSGPGRAGAFGERRARVSPARRHGPTWMCLRLPPCTKMWGGGTGRLRRSSATSTTLRKASPWKRGPTACRTGWANSSGATGGRFRQPWQPA